LLGQRAIGDLVQTKSRICIRLSVVMRFTRLHPGAQKGNAANYCSLFEPHYKQNLYTNPKRTAKSDSLSYDLGYTKSSACSKNFRLSKNFFLRPFEERSGSIRANPFPEI